MGDSFEEVPGTELAKQSRHFYWSWYDMQTEGFKNWIIINNPDAAGAVTYEIRIGGVTAQAGSIPAAGNVTATFPGRIGGPVEVIAGGPVMATQRVLSNNDTAFNEVPGIPVEELSTSYYWTWYDMQTEGCRNWVLVANPDPFQPVSYEIRIGGDVVNSGLIPPMGKVTPDFPGMRDGPVEVRASASVIATQRVISGPSFEEVPGYPYMKMARKYHWTWYDMTAGFRNWVMIANPLAFTVTYEVKIAGEVVGSGAIPGGGIVTPSFGGRMGGPVEVSASQAVIVSQRVLRNGHFNEVLGNTLTAGTALPPPELPQPELPEPPAGA